MSEFDDENDLVQDELETLKARADLMGLSYHPSIGVAKLREKVKAALESDSDKTEDKEDAVVKVAQETESQRRHRKRQEANRLVRVRITCMNPAKKEWEGEIFTVGNATVGTFKKYVPFNAEEGWHVPHIILEQIKARQCQVFVSSRDARGNSVRKGKLIKEFGVEELDPLTPEELEELAVKQAMSKSID